MVRKFRFLALACLFIALAVLAAGCAASGQRSRPLTYVAVGASDAVGVGTLDPATQGWVPKLGASLGPNTRVVNLGVSGSTVHQALSEQLGPAVDAHPDVVTVWLAVNDLNGRVALDQYASDLDRLLAGLEPTGAHVLVGNVPELAPTGAFQGANQDRLHTQISRWNAAIATTVESHHAQLVDLNSVWREVADHPEYISADGFHPSADGYTRLAQIFTEAYAQPG